MLRKLAVWRSSPVYLLAEERKHQTYGVYLHPTGISKAWQHPSEIRPGRSDKTMSLELWFRGCRQYLKVLLPLANKPGPDCSGRMGGRNPRFTVVRRDLTVRFPGRAKRSSQAGQAVSLPSPGFPTAPFPLHDPPPRPYHKTVPPKTAIAPSQVACSEFVWHRVVSRSERPSVAIDFADCVLFFLLSALRPRPPPAIWAWEALPPASPCPKRTLSPPAATPLPTTPPASIEGRASAGRPPTRPPSSDRSASRCASVCARGAPSNRTPGIAPFRPSSIVTTHMRTRPTSSTRATMPERSFVSGEG